MDIYRIFVQSNLPSRAGAYWRFITLLLLVCVAAGCFKAPPTPERHAKATAPALGKTVSVLPVFAYPNQAASVSASDLALAEANLSAHLQMARRMYRRMLLNPLDGSERGTFRLASWDQAQGVAVPVSDYHATVTPLSVNLSQTTMQIAAEFAQQPYAALSFLSEVMDAVGCTQVDCEFVFVVVLVDNPNAVVSPFGLKLNQGLNNGGGMVVFDWDRILNAHLGDDSCYQLPNNDPVWLNNGCRHLLSTMVHELGHSFGLNHVDEYGGQGLQYNDTQSPSIMANNPDNWIAGCGSGNASPNANTPCSYPSNHALIDTPARGAYIGVLLPDDKRVLGLNHRAFPSLEFVQALDTPTGTEEVLHHQSGGYADIPPQERLRFWPDDKANVLVGLPILQAWEPRADLRIWWSSAGSAGQWADLDVEFPWSVELTRIRLYAGHAGNTPMQGISYDVPTHARVLRIDYGNPIATQIGPTLSGFQPLNQTLALPTHAAPDRYRIQLARPASGYVVLRGVRFWGKKDGASYEQELFPTVEPIGVPSHSTYGGSVANVLGSDQEVKSYSASWDPASSWHSQAVACGNWVSVSVTFPEEVVLGAVKVHTGHSGFYHPAHTIQVERECVCRTALAGISGVCSSASNSNCANAGGDGKLVFEHVTGTFASPDQLVTFTPNASHRWKVAMRTTPGAGLCYINVRGLRFFSDNLLELFPARVVASGI